MFSGEADDIFDVFEESTAQDYSAYNTEDTERASKKRAADKALSSKDQAQKDMEEKMADSDDENVPQEKKARRGSPMPTVTDSFEQDLEREVASAAGLMPSAEGANVVLSHQVCI